MKFFSAVLATETNTFAPAPTGWGGFEEYGIRHGDASRVDPQGMGIYMVELGRLLGAEGHTLVESLSAFAQPLGRTVRAVYESMRDEIVADLRKALPVDGVILILHGAMVAENYDDCEGDLIDKVRAVVGPGVPIGVELDLHCHFTELMRRSADTIICYKEYPHVDGLERMAEVAGLVIDQAHGRIRPVMAMHDCRMVGMWHTTREPMIGFVRRMKDAEKRPGVLSVSLGHGFPWGDVPEAGAKLWVVADGDTNLAQSVADELAEAFWAIREETLTPFLSVDEALDAAMAVDGGPVVIADNADNPGGGAMGDSTFILEALLRRDIGRVVIGGFWDLGAIQICRDAGVGATIDLRLGGKCGPRSGQPIDVRVQVRAVIDDHHQSSLDGDARAPLGASVWVRAANEVDMLLISRRSQIFGTDAFTGLGIELDSKKLIVVKSSQHFHAQFAPLAKRVLYASSPGAIDTDFAALPYRVRDGNYWPRVADPRVGATVTSLSAATMPIDECAPDPLRRIS